MLYGTQFEFLKKKLLKMETSNIIITLLTVLTSAGAWKFYEMKMKMKSQHKKEDKQEQNMYRNDLRERVAVMEDRLKQEAKEKEDLLKEITDLKTLLAEYKVRLEFLEKENDRLKDR